MCSISGFISKNPLSSRLVNKLASALLYYGSERGDQSCGIFVNDKLLKRAVSADEFICSSEFEQFFDKEASSGLFHTRQPTSGGLGDKQAQPFIRNQTATIHNGWFTNCFYLKRHWNLEKTSGVDSELVTDFVHKYGVRKLPQFIKTTEGHSAFGILHRNNLYLMRSGNPTVYTFIDLNDDNTVFVFASTGGILQKAIRYCWLIPTTHPIRDTKEGILLRVTSTNLEHLSKKVEAKWHYYGDYSPYVRRYLGDEEYAQKEAWEDEEIKQLEAKFPESPYFQPFSDSTKSIT